MEKTGIPKVVFNVITGPSSEVGEEIAKNPEIDMIAFTGITEVRKRLSELGSSSVHFGALSQLLSSTLPLR